MRNLFQKASRLAQILLASSIPYLKAEPINWELSSGKRESTQQEIILRHRDNAEEVKKNNVRINAGLNSAGNEFTFEYFTEDFDRQDWTGDETEKVVPIYRHTPLSRDMQFLVRHPDTVVVGETKQKNFAIPEYRWENSIPFEEHKTTQAVFGLIERGVATLEEWYPSFWLGSSGVKFLVGYDMEKKYGNVFGEGENPKAKLMFQVVDRGLDEIFSRLPDSKFIPEELTGKVQEAVGEKLKDRYAEIFAEEEGKREIKKGYSTTRIPIHLPPKNFMRFSTAYSVTIPFSGKISEDDEVTFWTDPAFGDPSSQSGQNSYPIGFARFDDGVRIKLNLNLEKRTESKPVFATAPKTLEWYLPTEEETRGMICEEKRIKEDQLDFSQRERIRSSDKLTYLRLIIGENNDKARFKIFYIPKVQDRGSIRFGFGIFENNEENKKEAIEELSRREESVPIFLNKGFLIMPCRLRNENPVFEQEGILLNFLLRYHSRIGGEIIYQDEIMNAIRSSIKAGGKVKKITSEDITKAIVESWKLQKRFYDLGQKKTRGVLEREISPYRDFLILKDLRNMQDWQSYLKTVHLRKMDAERKMFGDGWLTMSENLRGDYLFCLRNVFMYQK